jgi:hypothetical protein
MRYEEAARRHNRLYRTAPDWRGLAQRLSNSAEFLKRECPPCSPITASPATVTRKQRIAPRFPGLRAGPVVLRHSRAAASARGRAARPCGRTYPQFSYEMRAQLKALKAALPPQYPFLLGIGEAAAVAADTGLPGGRLGSHRETAALPVPRWPSASLHPHPPLPGCCEPASTLRTGRRPVDPAVQRVKTPCLTLLGASP